MTTNGAVVVLYQIHQANEYFNLLSNKAKAPECAYCIFRNLLTVLL
jgi:hypothetical protein